MRWLASLRLLRFDLLDSRQTWLSWRASWRLQRASRQEVCNVPCALCIVLVHGAQAPGCAWRAAVALTFGWLLLLYRVVGIARASQLRTLLHNLCAARRQNLANLFLHLLAVHPPGICSLRRGRSLLCVAVSVVQSASTVHRRARCVEAGGRVLAVSGFFWGGEEIVV